MTFVVPHVRTFFDLKRGIHAVFTGLYIGKQAMGEKRSRRAFFNDQAGVNALNSGFFGNAQTDMNRQFNLLSSFDVDGVGNAIRRFFGSNRDAGYLPLTDQVMAAGCHVGNVGVLKDVRISA
jgi:hypothetical protein